ncbi:MAG: DNA polymerase/3'-5' exonuclease PolX [Clostridiales bacterium]|nr:DNA polymerase/3'-5' exonuclease PolX [Clostridiales bacterium]
MPVHNSDISEVFNRTADYLDIKGENPFRIRAYRNAARIIGSLSRSVADMVAHEEDLTKIQGIGQDLAGKIKEIVKTGTLPLLEQLKRELSPELSALMEIPGLGPKRVKVLYDEMGIRSVDELRQAAEEGKVRTLPGFGAKTESVILEEIGKIKETKKGGLRLKLAVAEQVVEPLVGYLKKIAGVKEIDVAGSYRRRRETVGDLDILVACGQSCPVMDKFVGYEDVEKTLSRGKTRSSVVFRNGIQVDLRVVPEASYGAALLYFTGSKAHNIAIRKIAQKKKLKINEYGVFRGEKRIAGRTEKDVYKQVGLPWIEPELREDRGEVEAAQEKRLPRLVRLEDIRGDLHVHTTWSDGRSSLEDMAEAAKRLGYEYLAVSDHSKHVTVAHGLDEKRLSQQIKEIDRLNGKLKGLRLLKSIELDILESGSLDLPDRVLEDLDLVICSVHSKFNLSREKQTERIIRAMDNPHVHIFCHPTGRLINERRPYEVDLERVMNAAKERGCHLELNAHPDRLDLDDVECKRAKEIGLKVAIATDAHSLDDLRFMRFGVGQARRGWLEPEDVLNTKSWEELEGFLKRY